LNLDFPEFIPFMSVITSILFFVSLTLFGWLSIKSKNIRSFQSQILIFIGLYVIGELFEIKELGTALSIPEELGSQIHVAATIFLAIVVWTRLYYSKKGIKTLTDTPNTGDMKT
jgi:hypothetical protein